MSVLDRHTSKRTLRRLVQSGGHRTVMSGAGSGGTTSGAAGDGIASSVTTVSGLPKFIMGHPVLGAIPADPVTNPTWEI